MTSEGKIQKNTLRNVLKPIDEIMSYRHERLLKRFTVDYNTSSEEAERCFEALKQFLIVCAIKPGYKVTSDSIDRMWHTFLLFTKDYKSFCEDNLGMFINHEPFETAFPNAYIETRAFAQNFFEHIDEYFWNLNAKADCSSGCGE